MSMLRSATIALSTAAFAATLVMGAQAHSADHPAATRVASHALPAKAADPTIASGHTAPGQGWLAYNGTDGLFIDVNTRSGGFTGTPTYTTSVGGIGGQWALTGTSAIYQATASGFRVYVRWSDGHPITPADAQRYDWHVNWIGVQGS